MDVQLPDGTIVKGVPDGISRAELTAKLSANGYDIGKLSQSAAVAPTKSTSPTDGNSGFENFAVGVGKGMTDFAYGAKQRLDDAAAYIEKKIVDNGGGKINDAINNALGLKSAAEVQKLGQEAIAEKRRIDAPIMLTTGGKVGNMVGQAAPALAASLIPGAQGLAGSVVTGAALGAAAPTLGDESVTRNALEGAAGGAAGYGIAKGVSRILSPASNANPALKALRDEGVQPTIGQTLGGAWNKAEQKLQSIPILGDGIISARNRALSQFDNAAINRATAPIGVKIEGTGQQAVKEAGDALSHAYDSALLQVPHVTLDSQFATDLQQLHGMAQNLVPTMSQKFDKVLSDVVLNRASPQGSMLGETYKTVDSELGNIASKFGKSQVASEAEFGDAVAQLKNLLNQNMRRNNPAVAQQLDKIDTGWANLVRIEQAAKSAKNAEGVFTPAQLNSAVQMMDDSTRGRAVSRGTALMQDLSNAGQQVLGGTVPDSGTVGRLAMGGGALATGFAQPAIPLSLGAGALAYSQPMQTILNHVLSTRPALAAPIANTISNYARIGGVMGAATAVTQRQKSDQAIAEIGQAQNVGDAIDAAQRALAH